MRIIFPLIFGLMLINAKASEMLLESSEGKAIYAELIHFNDKNNTVQVKRSGKLYTLPLTRFSESTQEKLKKHFTPKEPTEKKEENIKKASPEEAPPPSEEAKAPESPALKSKINKAIGHPLFLEKSLWQEPTSKVAERLKWLVESDTDFTSSYRLYAPADYRFLSARPYSAVLYGGPNQTCTNISLVYANKGDFFSAAGSGQDHFKKKKQKRRKLSFPEALDADNRTLTAALTKALGPGLKQRFGDRTNRRNVTRWDYKNYSFLLSFAEEEYVGLSIVPKSVADAKGDKTRVSDGETRKRLKANLKKLKNGDTYITNIPMVDQGPKGYCAPATFERAMRYMGIPSDMYLLATTGGTDQGGTHTGYLYSEVRSMVYSKGRRAKDLELHDDFKIRSIKRYIDKGVPVLWQMCSLPLYNKIANERTAARKKVTKWSKYSKSIKQEADQNFGNLYGRRANFHICLIIGYNEKTGEIAVSDSWGEGYECRWIHEKEAAAVTSKGGFIIDL